MREERGGVNQIRGSFICLLRGRHCLLPSKQTNLLFLSSSWRVLEEGPAAGCTEGKVWEEGSGAALAQIALQPLPTGLREERDGGHEGNARLDRDRGQEKSSQGKERELNQKTESPEQIKREIEIMRERLKTHGDLDRHKNKSRDPERHRAQSISKYLLTSSCHLPGTVLGPEDTDMNKAKPFSHRTPCLVE